MKLVFLDTETTGNDPARDRLCEVCYQVDGELEVARFKPPVPMSVKAMSITHITEKMLEGLPPFKGSEMSKQIEGLLADGILVCHNCAFDAAMLEAENIAVPRRICTLKVARHLDPEGKIPEYGLQYLRYHLGIEVDGGAHDAATDVKVLAALFERLLAKMEASGMDRDAALAEMERISALPSLIRTFKFGKYNGMRVEDVAKSDPGYLDWLLMQKRNSDRPEEDWIYTINHYLGYGQE
jgi:exodeoxyribonuclease X